MASHPSAMPIAYPFRDREQVRTKGTDAVYGVIGMEKRA
jgi:hypothetical protein